MTETALVVVQYPDFFGRIYDYTQLIESAHQMGALVCVAANPIALGLLKTPGEMGADIVVGEGQPLGIPLSYGGPYLGFFATRKQFIHKMAGRLVGETVDTRGQRAYVLTLTAREQHIKRERATSNICTNQGLLALAAAVYLSLLGPGVAYKLREMRYQAAAALAEQAPLLQHIRAVDAHLGIRSRLDTSSTDANIPLSLGIPAIAIGGGGAGGGAHTNQEWYQPDARDLGLKRILLTLLLMLLDPGDQSERFRWARLIPFPAAIVYSNRYQRGPRPARRWLGRK